MQNGVSLDEFNTEDLVLANFELQKETQRTINYNHRVLEHSQNNKTINNTVSLKYLTMRPKHMEQSYKSIR